MQNIGICLWFDNQAEDAVKLYTTLFSDSKIGKISRYSDTGAAATGMEQGAAMVVPFEIAGRSMMGLNGGPQFKFTQALSLFVWCDSEEEIDRLWKILSAGGSLRMSLDKYPWAPKYGWTADRFGVEWQLILASNQQKIAPAFLFVKELFGKGEEAINFYTSIFKNSKIKTLERNESTKSVMHSLFSLGELDFALMEGQGEHDFTFSPAFSHVVKCENQQEVDYFWDALSTGGVPGQCGWLTDRYGVSWQIVPTALARLMSDPHRSGKVMAAMLQMKKIEISKLEQA